MKISRRPYWIAGLLVVWLLWVVYQIILRGNITDGDKLNAITSFLGIIGALQVYGTWKHELPKHSGSENKHSKKLNKFMNPLMKTR